MKICANVCVRYQYINSTKTLITLNPRRIHEIYVDYVDVYLFKIFTSHVDIFHVDNPRGSILISNAHSKIHVDSMLLIYVAATQISRAVFVGFLPWKQLVKSTSLHIDEQHRTREFSNGHSLMNSNRIHEMNEIIDITWIPCENCTPLKIHHIHVFRWISPYCNLKLY